MKARILVIDDDADVRDSLKMILEYEGYDCLLAPSGQEGIGRVERERPDLVFVDIKMPGMDGLEVVRRIKVLDGILPVVIISGHGTVSTAVEATKLGAFDFLEKPLASERVVVTIRNALDRHRLEDENRSLRSAATVHDKMVGESKALGLVTDTIRRVAPTNATVLVLGESGVGKELVARAIHRSSLRKKEQFVQVNCAAIPEDLIESELFGHERGAFTGATGKQIGKFQQADRGTIFLDEVGDMSLRTQSKVLRVLQEGEVERLGSTRMIKVDVRVVAATNKRLKEEMDNGRFRDDLYFRLSVIPINVPPLRDHPEDIPAMVCHFTEQFSHKNNFRSKTFSDVAIELMKGYSWKGNARELRNMVERLIIMTPSDTIGERDVVAILHVNDKVSETGNYHGRVGTLRGFKETSERQFLVEMLKKHEWNIAKTAEVIATPRSNLYKKLEQYKITEEVDG